MRYSNSKILSLQKLIPVINQLKIERKIIVLAHGVFDLMHYGHIHHLQQAKKMGDILVVSVVTDTFIKKGSGRPIFNHNIRINSIASLECVDYVVPCKEIGPYVIIKRIKPHIYTKGEDVAKLLKDPLSGLNKDKELVESVQGRLRFTKSIPIHSTELLKKYAEVYADEDV
jgi:rfaE bifunctional protein nucleotidyltransferase chain/domain